jgi:hypothetical protein
LSLERAMSIASEFVTPIADKLPAERNLGVAKVTLPAIVLLALICFLAGLIASKE